MIALPKIGVKISGDDGGDDMRWSDSLLLDFPSLLIGEVIHKRAQVRSLITYLYAWDEALETMSKIAANQAVSEKREMERLGV